MESRPRVLGGAVAVATLVASPVMTACADGSPARSSASCVGPYLDAQPPGGDDGAPEATARPGETLTVYGHWYTSTCNDTGGHDPLQPLAPVHLTLVVPGKPAVPLGEFTPHGRDLGFRVEVRVPVGASAGTATISDDRSYPSIYRFRVTPRDRALRR